jgi:hypothetical protein
VTVTLADTTEDSILCGIGFCISDLFKVVRRLSAGLSLEFVAIQPQMASFNGGLLHCGDPNK